VDAPAGAGGGDQADQFASQRGLGRPTGAPQLDQRWVGTGQPTDAEDQVKSLVTEVFADQLAACVPVVDEALADPDAWHGLGTVCDMPAVDRGLTAAFPTAFPDAVD
jgi:hypothetical protein